VVEAPNIALAFAAGLVSFLSPCCLPLVPGYLATVAGIAPGAPGRRVDPRVILGSLVFVATFSLIFVVLGLTATAVGDFLFETSPPSTRWRASRSSRWAVFSSRRCSWLG
jgi:cytochrome c-type biogenesis protein